MDKRAMSVMHSSKKPDWGTPQELFDYLDGLFGFDLDVCAISDNTKCQEFISPEEDALDVPWSNGESMCWMNPPYGRGIGAWVEKASRHYTVALLPARVDTKWFQTVWKKASSICFIQGRVKFEGAEHPAPFPSCIAVFGYIIDEKQRAGLEALGHVLELE